MTLDSFYNWNISYPCVDTPARKWILNGTGLPFTAPFRIYLRSVFEYIAALPNIKEFQMNVLHTHANKFWPGLDLATVDLHDAIASVEDGRALTDLEAGIWRVARGLPISGLDGCSFFASIQVRGFWGIDLCEEGKTTGIRVLCPESCGCKRKPTLPGCPLTCSREAVLYQPGWICEDSECRQW